MITTDDADYLRAKRIRQGVERLDPAFDEFVAEFTRRFGVAPLSLFTDVDDRQPKPFLRLGVGLERAADARCFRTRSGASYDAAKQKAVAEIFVSTVPARAANRMFGRGLLGFFGGRLAPADLFVYFSDFEGVAKQDVHAAVTDQERAGFEAGLDLGDRFWCTERLFGAPIVFVHTAEQARELEASDLPATWADTYFEIARRHDEFGYLVRDEIMIGVDSKENFEQNFAGNWYYYFK